VSRVLEPAIDRGRRSPDEIRRDKNYLDAVDEIWQLLKRYVT
jgi:NitT/TauT family transport system ATP-binding protein